MLIRRRKQEKKEVSDSLNRDEMYFWNIGTRARPSICLHSIRATLHSDFIAQNQGSETHRAGFIKTKSNTKSNPAEAMKYFV